MGTDLIAVTNATDQYPPTFHWLIGKFWVEDLTSSVYQMRAFVALGCTLLLMVPLVLISVVAGLEGLRRFGPVLLACLSPLAFFLFGSVNPSSWEMAGAVCSWGCMAALLQTTRRAHMILALVGMVLGVLIGALIRPNGGLMLLAGLCLAAPIPLTRVAPRELRPRRRFWTGVTIGYLLLGAGTVALVPRGVLSITWGPHPYPPAEEHSALWHWWTDALSFGDYLWGSFTRLGWLDTPIPSIVALIFTAVVGYLVLTAVRQGRTVVTASLVMVTLAACFLTTAILATGTPPDRGLQTRYMWPLYIGVPMIAALTPSIGVRTKADDVFGGHVRLVVGGGLIVASSIAFFTNIRRYTVGLKDFPFLVPERWQPPVLSTGTLLVTFVVAYVALVVLLNYGRLTAPISLTRRSRTHT